MRKHKFKAWSIPEKRWINLNGFCISFNGCDDEGAVYEVTEQGVLHVIDVDSVEIVEWTGLKDINGCEMYEGDVIEIGQDSPPNLQTIVYRGSCFEGSEECETISYLVRHDDVRVIGNCFEYDVTLYGVELKALKGDPK